MRPQVVIFAPAHLRESVFPKPVVEEIAKFGEILGEPIDPESWPAAADRLAHADVIVGTWGMPTLDQAFLDATPRLRAVLYAAGSVKGFVTPETWQRGVVVSSAWGANGIPVSEYTLGTILLSLKRFWHFSRAMRTPDGIGPGDLTIPGAYRSKVGLVSMGVIGRAVARLLQAFEIDVLAYDPYLPHEQAEEAGVQPVTLEKLFAECDVVSIHTPWIPQTQGMIGRKLIALMKPGATLINTSRGAIIVEAELCDVLGQRPDLSAILDVTFPEPPAPDSPLRTLPNVVLTPHVAGSMQQECARMGMWMAAELERLARGARLRHEVTREMLTRMA